MMKKYLLYSALFLVLTACGKIENSTKMYSAKVCNNAEDAMTIATCKKNCSGSDENTSFNVDTATNKVVETRWKDKKKIGVTTLPGCSVADKENWSCKEREGNGFTETASMLGHIVSVVVSPNMQMAMCYSPISEK